MAAKVALSVTVTVNVPVSQKTIWTKSIRRTKLWYNRAGFPLYYWNLNVQLRTAMDFLFAPEENDGNPLRDHAPVYYG